MKLYNYNMELLEHNNTLKNNINLDIDNRQKTFLETNIGKVVDSAVDLGIRTVLPNLIEDQVIDIKNIILDQGFKDGLSEIINTGLDFGKSAIGVLTGNFENISQVQMAVKKGGIIDSISRLLDFSINLAAKTNLISNDMASVIKSGKNTIMENITVKVENELTSQIREIEKLDKYCNKWQEALENKDLTEMNKIYRNIQKHEQEIIPIERVINNIRKIDNIQELIKSKENIEDITDNELVLAGKII